MLSAPGLGGLSERLSGAGQGWWDSPWRIEFGTFTYSYDNSAQLVDIDGDGILDGSFISATGGTAGYGYKYNFKNALSADGTIVLPPNTATPSVFELKNPNTNIQGRVR